MIQLEHIDRAFQVGDQQVHALRNVEFSVSSGEYVSIMGPSGSGKSTLLNILGLLDRPSNGKYLLNGKDTTLLTEKEQAQARSKNIGFIFQFFHLVPRLTAAENVELPMVLAGIPVEERRSKIKEVLHSLGMGDRMNHRPEQLSGGQRQRVAIARAIMMGPSILLADEPTGNLDRSSGKEVVAILEKFVENGLTLIVVTHDPELGSRAQRQIQMVDGSVVSDR